MAEIASQQSGWQAPSPSALSAKLAAIVGRLEEEARKRVGKRASLEKRWIEDLQQYWGKYDTTTAEKLKEGEKSQLFINLTGPKTDAMSARLMDLLFPTDDRNWGIQPTPVPALVSGAKKSAAAARALAAKADDKKRQAQAAEAGADQALLAEAEALEKDATAAAEYAAEQNAIMAEAKDRAELMQSEIDDQLTESLYHAVMRDVIDQACKLGTGVAKGPVTGDKLRKGWKAKEGDVGYELKMAEGDQPAMRFVDAWGFFPDMDVASIDNSEGVLERHLMNKKRLRKLADLKGFDKNAIRRLLTGKAQTGAPAYLADLRNITGDNQQAASDLYHVWEYTGPLEAEDMRHLALAIGDEGTLKDLDEVDPLTELNAIVWFCQGELLKFAIYPYDSGECIYSVFNLKKDESSIFGYGIPAIIRDPQKSTNAGWRAMMDNAGLASGPQIVIDQSQIEPADGKWTMLPRKVWLKKAGAPVSNARPFETYNIEMHQAEMANIVVMSRQMLDEMAAIPQVAQGELGTVPKQTPVGTTVLMMNGANVVFRRIVKSFDDDMTTPTLRRYYDWNMQFSPKEEIKGDYCVDARGSSVLLVREMQAQNLMVIALQLGAHPKYGPMLKDKGVLRKLFQAHMIPADDVMLSDDQIDAILAQAAGQNEAAAAMQAQAELETRKIDLEESKIQAQVEMSNMENATRLSVAELEHQTQMMKLAETMNMNLDKLEAMLTDKREQRAHAEKIVAAEIISAKQTGVHAGGKI